MENLKKYRNSVILAILCAIFLIIHICLPSKSTVNEIEVKKVEKKIKMVEVKAYYVDNSSLQEKKLSLEEASYSNLLKEAIEDILNKYSENSKKIKLLNIYFSESLIYFELDSKNINPLLKEAIRKTSEELVGISDIRFM